MLTRCMGCMAEYMSDMGSCPYCGYAEGAPVENANYLPPHTLLENRYRLGRVVGVSDYSVTYVAWDTLLELRIAVKEYLPAQLAGRVEGLPVIAVEGGDKSARFVDGLRQFIEEARRLARFQSEPGIVRVFDSFEANNTAYMVMEHLDGETLAQYLAREGKLPARRAVEILLPVIRSLEELHREGIIHRDIAPDNIMLTRSGQVKLIDFGAARHAMLARSRDMTAAVKPGYSPEEQYGVGGEQGPQTDVYALAGVLYTMITGAVPIDAMERRNALEGKKRRDILVPPSKLAEVDKKLDIAILNALEVDARRRTGSAGAFHKELSALGTVRRIGPAGGGLLSGVPKWGWIAMGAGVLLLALVSGWLLLGPQGTGGDRPGYLENMVSVPDVVNAELTSAQQELQAEGLTVVIVGTQATNTVAPDVVLDQSPEAGDRVERGSIVQLIVSVQEVVPVAMPDLANSTQDEAMNILCQQLGASVTVQTEYNSEVAQGAVIRASLEPGASVSPGDVIILYVSQGPEPVQASPLSLSKKSINVKKGATYRLQVSGGDGTYSWRVGNKKIATVNDGLVTAVGEGTTRVFVSSGGEEVFCYVVVKGDEQGGSTQQPVEQPAQAQHKVSLSETSTTISKVGRTKTLVAYSEPQALLIDWKSDNKAVATVNSAGRVTAVAPGTAKITVTFSYGGGVTYTRTCTVTVSDG